MPTNITEQEKQELLNIGQWGNKKGEQAWNKQCDKMKKARDGSYPDDWYQLIIIGDLYTKPLKPGITIHDLDAAKGAGTHNAASKYMRGAGSSAWLDDSASQREARKQRRRAAGSEARVCVACPHGRVLWGRERLFARTETEWVACPHGRGGERYAATDMIPPGANDPMFSYEAMATGPPHGRGGERYAPPSRSECQSPRPQTHNDTAPTISNNEIPIGPNLSETEKIRQQIMMSELENGAAGYAAFG